MLNQIFQRVFDISLTASLVISFVIFARLLIHKSPKIFSYILWGVVLFRLISPVTFESDFSIISTDNKSQIYDNSILQNITSTDTQIFLESENILPLNYINHNQNLNLISTEKSFNYTIDFISFISYIWLFGAIFMFYLGARELFKLKKSILYATRLKNSIYGDNIFIVDYIKSPFVLGFFKPKIYIPSNIIKSDLDFIISHEKYHIKRFDHITRILGFIALCFHWFNPFVWIAFILSDKDMELSCDEYVLKKATHLNEDIRVKYSNALLYFACNFDCRHKLISITPHAFGESSSTKHRIKNIMIYKKSAVWVSILLAGFVSFTTVVLAFDKTTHIVDEFLPQNYTSYIPKFNTLSTDENSIDEVILFTDKSIVLYQPNTQNITFEYEINFTDISTINNVILNDNYIIISCIDKSFAIDRKSKVLKNINILVDEFQFIDQHTLYYESNQDHILFDMSYNLLNDEISIIDKIKHN